MKDIGRTLVHYFVSMGINPFWGIVFFGALGLFLERSNIKQWKSLSYNERQWHGTLITGDIFFLIVGLLYVLGALK